MNELLALTAQNTAVALAFALLVLGLSRVVRKPPLVHLLWLLVLLKLVAPPIFRIESSLPRLPRSAAGSERSIAAPPTAEIQPPSEDARQAVETAFAMGGEARATASDLASEPAEFVSEKNPAAGARQFSLHAASVLGWTWLAGSVLCALAAATRIVRFERRLRNMLPAPERLQRLMLETAARLGLRRAPDLRCAESIATPLLWRFFRRPTIVLPTGLLRQLDEEQLAMVLAHELAHLRRRDPWVRVVELVVSIFHWWNPLTWLIRRQLHQAEDLCCDAWVRWAFPDCRKRYAEVLLKAAETLGASPRAPGLLPASPFLRSCLLKARIEMILESQFKPCVSWRSMCAVALLAALVLPSFALISKSAALAAPDEEVPATPSKEPTSATRSEFPYVVKFEQGATRFADGDKIEIVEVRGTSETFKPGDIYWIKGKYALASHDRATLAAYVTANKAADGFGRSYTAQTTTVKKGSGDFTLFLPMACEGLPHVSFYPADGGEGFGGNYFGTGDSVLKKWWDAKPGAAKTGATRKSTSR